MAEPTTATPTALDRLQLQLDTAQLTLLTAAGQAAGQTPSVGGNAIVLTSASSPATIKQEIESRAIQDMSPWKALGDRVFVVFVPKFREKGLIFEPIVKTQRGSLLDLCKQRNHATHILAGNASFFGLPDDATDLELTMGIEPSRVIVPGFVIQNGAVVTGLSRPDRAAVQYQSGRLSAHNGDALGIGTPGVNAIGGVLPVIVSGQKLIPAPPPATKPDPRPWPDRVYSTQNKPFVGKSLVGYHSEWDMAVAIWQRDAQANNGMDGVFSTSTGYFALDVIRDFLFDLGFDHAVGMDGSSSVLLYIYPTRTEHHATSFTEWPYKDDTMVVAYVIRRPS